MNFWLANYDTRFLARNVQWWIFLKTCSEANQGLT